MRTELPSDDLLQRLAGEASLITNQLEENAIRVEQSQASWIVEKFSVFRALNVIDETLDNKIVSVLRDLLNG